MWLYRLIFMGARWGDLAHCVNPCTTRARSGLEPPEHHNIAIVPTSTRHNSTTMDPIQEVIEEIESCKSGAKFSTREVAKKFGVDRTRLPRRHQGQQRTNEAYAQDLQLLNPQQELELVRYMEKCTGRGLPSTRELVANFASAIAKWEVAKS